MIRMKTKNMIVALLALFTGCATYYPQVVDVPLIKEKGDLRVNYGASWSPSLHGTVSYGATEILAVQTYGSYDLIGRFHLQGALGLFKKFENNAVIELYGGYGYGNRITQYDDKIHLTNREYHFPFVQFNIGKSDHVSVNVEYGLGLKAGYLNTYLLSSYDFSPSYRYSDWVIEPCVFFRFGKKVKMNVMFKYSFPMTNVISREYYAFNNINVGLGVNLSFLTKTTK